MTVFSASEKELESVQLDPATSQAMRETAEKIRKRYEMVRRETAILTYTEDPTKRASAWGSLQKLIDVLEGKNVQPQ